MEKDYMTMNLSLLKDLQKNYAIAMTEASNEKIYKCFKKGYDLITSMQRQTFNVMDKNNMYNLKNVQIKEIKSDFDTLNKEYKKIKMSK